MKMRMRDLLKLEHPECISEDYLGGCDGCPTMWGHELYPGKCEPSEGVLNGRANVDREKTSVES